MEDRPLETLKAILTARGVKDEKFETIGNPLDQTRMYLFGGVLIIFSEKTRLTDSEVNNFINYASENNHTSGIIIISPTNPSEKVLKLLREHISERSNPLIQIFYLSHLNFDISKHRKVPKHRILSEDEVTKMMKDYNVEKLESLPKIDSQDAMAKWIGARPGDVVEITGLCGSSAENKRYRFCLAECI
jgi:DNA-directed RNA polymerase subunit H (RpoH/RPB5)